ncbi:MAG: hypothetical protein KatS3mg014_1661 [Actinomycetota bacterium]|nr:MAG: hypothetical protein KatS3mg014_1661 [Actinomycetota bacterium]
MNGWFRDAGEEGARVLLGRLLGTGLGVGAAIAAVGALLAPVLPWAIGAGADAGTKRAAVAMTALLFVTVATRIGAEVFRAALNARFSFVAPAAMPLVENLTVLATLLLFHGTLGVTAVAVGYVAGGVTQLTFVAAAAARRGLLVRPRLGLGREEARRIRRLLALPLAGAGLTMLARVAERLFASFLPPGQLTILGYGWVVVNSIGGTVFFRSVVVALLPRLAEARDDERATRSILTDGIRLMLLVSLPLLVALVVLAEPLVAVAFQRGRFGPAQAALLAQVIAVYALQFPFDAVTRAYMSYWFARLHTLVPFVNVVVMVVLDVTVAAALFLPLGIFGIALAYDVAAVGYLLHGAWSVHRRVSLPGRALAADVARILAASGISGLVMWAVLQGLRPDANLAGRLVRLVVPGAAGALALLVVLAVLGIRIWSVLLPWVRRRPGARVPGAGREEAPRGPRSG